MQTNTIFMNATANTPKAAKALATTISRGITLLADGYAVKTENKVQYLIRSKEGSLYIVTHDEPRGQYHCTCEAFNALNCCKHLVGVHLGKREIDAKCDAAKVDNSDWK